jgi:predicted lactoylglutathione lyase
MSSKAKIDFITIAVMDLSRSMAFYENAFGFPTQGIQEGSEDHCLFALDDAFQLVLYQRDHFLPMTPNPDQKERSAGFMLSHIEATREQVDLLVERALTLGATAVGEPADEEWGYSVRIADPDGHPWEIVALHA